MQPVLAPDGDRPWRILELVARNAELPEILNEVVLLMRHRFALEHCAILTVRGERLVCVASVGTSEGLLDCIDNRPLVGLSGVADRLRAAGFRELAADSGAMEWRCAAACGVRGCWTEPIVSAAGEVLGEVLAFDHGAGAAESAAPEGLSLAARIAATVMEQRFLMTDLQYQGRHDATTLLPNRILFEERMGEAIAAARQSGAGLALLHLDLDRFGTVNDLLGRGVGDLLLEQVARRFEGALRNGDTLARCAGDEFSAILPGIANPDEAVFAGERLRARLAAPFAVAGHDLTVRASVGCAIYPAHAADGASLERCADAALQRAKRTGRNRVCAFSAEDGGAGQRKAQLESALGQALDRGEFRVVYQPQIDLTTMQLVGAEALLRWQHPVIGFVSPATFIPMAEETGFIMPIGRWVLDQACLQAAAWRRLGSPLRIAINVSAVQFAQDDFVPSVVAAVEACGIDPSAVELELTESALVGEMREVAARMRELKALGVWLSVDDFGTGYSSFATLQELPVDTIKIDISFVRQIVAADRKHPVIDTIVSMARSMGKRLVAEGIETLAQQSYLAAIGCDIAQGYRFGRPMAPEDFAARWIAAGPGPGAEEGAPVALAG